MGKNIKLLSIRLPHLLKGLPVARLNRNKLSVKKKLCRSIFTSSWEQGANRFCARKNRELRRTDKLPCFLVDIPSKIPSVSFF